jgi:hypothetical protein
MTADPQEGHPNKKADYDDTHAHRVVSTAKLVVTFSAAIAATFVVAAIQAEHDPWWLDEIAAPLMFVALLCTIRVVMLPPRPHKSKRAKDAQELADQAHMWMVWQIWISSAASLVAAIGLLVCDWHLSWFPK